MMFPNQTFNSFQASVVFQIENSFLICSANQMIGFYTKCNSGLKGVNKPVATNNSIKIT